MDSLEDIRARDARCKGWLASGSQKDRRSLLSLIDKMGQDLIAAKKLVREAQSVIRQGDWALEARELLACSQSDAATKRCTCKQHRTDGRQATEPDCPIHFDAGSEPTRRP